MNKIYLSECCDTENYNYPDNDICPNCQDHSGFVECEEKETE